MINRCGCTSQYQDSLYGKGMRVFNPCGKKEERKGRCTVCGNIKGFEGGEDKSEGVKKSRK